MGHTEIRHNIFFIKNSEVFHWLLWLKWTQIIKMEQNQTFSIGYIPNIISFFKILKYINDFCNGHRSISLQKWPQTVKMKSLKWSLSHKWNKAVPEEKCLLFNLIS